MPFINKLTACWQGQNNLLSNPIALPAPGWLMIPVHHDLEESKESWLSLLPKMLTGWFSLDTGTVDAQMTRKDPSWAQLFAECSLLCCCCHGNMTALLYQLPSFMKSLWVSHKKPGKRGAGKKEQECYRLQGQQRTKIRRIWALKQSWLIPQVSFLLSKGRSILK